MRPFVLAWQTVVLELSDEYAETSGLKGGDVILMKAAYLIEDQQDLKDNASLPHCNGRLVLPIKELKKLRLSLMLNTKGEGCKGTLLLSFPVSFRGRSLCLCV